MDIITENSLRLKVWMNKEELSNSMDKLKEYLDVPPHIGPL
jgi:hypothetical protein